MSSSELQFDNSFLNVVEALVFAANEPVKPSQITQTYAAITGDKTPDDTAVMQAVQKLNLAYEAEGHVLRIQSWAGGFRMATTDTVGTFLELFFDHNRRVKLSRPLMETLAILSYRQPATRVEIDYVRGVKSDYALRKLLELKLISISGRARTVGQPLLYMTTDRFLEMFGLNDLSELPNLRDIEALLDDPGFSKERARLLMLNGLGTPPRNQ